MALFLWPVGQWLAWVALPIGTNGSAAKLLHQGLFTGDFPDLPALARQALRCAARGLRLAGRVLGARLMQFNACIGESSNAT
jgi:hypothetical protein